VYRRDNASECIARHPRHEDERGGVMDDITALNLRMIAALAAKTAVKVEQRKLWDGELESTIAEMRKLLSEIKT
jgi:hypothetical protein